MATAAEPRPASLPLPGGKDGAAVKLHPLLCARMIGPPAMFHREEGRLAPLKAMGVRVPRDEWTEVPIVAFLAEHPTAGPVLIDTGFHPSVAVDPKQGMGRLGGLIFKEVRMETEDAVPGQLRRLGIDPTEVKTVVMTHLHSDHASGIAEFPGATFVLSSAEWEAAVEGPRDRRLHQAPVRPRLRLPAAGLRGGTPTRSPASAARSTCSETAACAWPSRPGTPTATARWCCASRAGRR